MEHQEFDGQRPVNDFLAGIDKRPIKGSHALATLGSATRIGGKIATASSSMHIKGHRIACVGDIVRYQDGTESRIVSGGDQYGAELQDRSARDCVALGPEEMYRATPMVIWI